MKCKPDLYLIHKCCASKWTFNVSIEAFNCRRGIIHVIHSDRKSSNTEIHTPVAEIQCFLTNQASVLIQKKSSLFAWRKTQTHILINTYRSEMNVLNTVPSGVKYTVWMNFSNSRIKWKLKRFLDVSSCSDQSFTSS